MSRKNTELEKRRKQELSDLKRLQFHPDTEKIIKQAAFEFTGIATTLESALGAYFIGQIHGWRILRIIHGSTTYNNYEKILGIKFKDYCPDVGILGTRNSGYRVAESLKSFWKIATGKFKTTKDLKTLDSGLDSSKTPD